MIDFLLIGGAKCGSTSVADYLKKSGQIAFTRKKEPAILNQRGATADQIETQYDRLLNRSHARHAITGEGTTAYSDLKAVPTVLHNLDQIGARPKVILVARNPVKRLQSHYFQALKTGRVRRPGPDAEFKYYYRSLSLWSRGLFGSTLELYTRALGKERVLALRFDDIVSDESEDLARLSRFLGIDAPGGQFCLPKSNRSVGSVKGNPISAFYRQLISKHYRRLRLPRLTRVARLINRAMGREIQSSDVSGLTTDQIEFARRFYQDDACRFAGLTGWNYWDLEK
jgi:hypothetical protein